MRKATGPQTTSKSQTWLKEVVWAQRRCTAVKGIDLPIKQCKGNRRGFSIRPVKGNASSHPDCAKWSSDSPKPGSGSSGSEVNGLISERRKIWLERRVNLNIQKPASYYIVLSWMSPRTTNTTKIGEFMTTASQNAIPNKWMNELLQSFLNTVDIKYRLIKNSDTIWECFFRILV